MSSFGTSPDLCKTGPIFGSISHLPISQKPQAFQSTSAGSPACYTKRARPGQVALIATETKLEETLRDCGINLAHAPHSLAATTSAIRRWVDDGRDPEFRADLLDRLLAADLDLRGDEHLREVRRSARLLGVRRARGVNTSPTTHPRDQDLESLQGLRVTRVTRRSTEQGTFTPSEARVAEPGPRGWSTAAIAAELTKQILPLLEPRPRNPRHGYALHSVTFTVNKEIATLGPSEHLALITATRDRFLRRFCHLWPGGGILLHLDRPPGNEDHLHLHGIVILRSDVEPDRVIQAWIRACKATKTSQGDRLHAEPDAQFIERRKTRRAIRNTLRDHHLKKTRRGEAIPGLPVGIGDRVAAAGKLKGPWLAAYARSGLARWSDTPETETSTTAQHDAPQASTLRRKPRARSRKLRPGQCRWCRARAQTGAEKWCGAACRSAASRAVVRAEKRHPGLAQFVEEIEAEGWARRDAIRMARWGLEHYPEHLAPCQPHKLVEALRCRCGDWIRDDPRALTCGENSCREACRELRRTAV